MLRLVHKKSNAVVSMLFILVIFVIISCSFPALANTMSDRQKIEDAIQKYGKSNIIKYILEKRYGFISTTFTDEYSGRPRKDLVNTDTILNDIKIINQTIDAFLQGLIKYLKKNGKDVSNLQMKSQRYYLKKSRESKKSRNLGNSSSNITNLSNEDFCKLHVTKYANLINSVKDETTQSEQKIISEQLLLNQVKNIKGKIGDAISKIRKETSKNELKISKERIRNKQLGFETVGKRLTERTYVLIEQDLNSKEIWASLYGLCMSLE